MHECGGARVELGEPLRRRVGLSVLGLPRRGGTRQDELALPSQLAVARVRGEQAVEVLARLVVTHVEEVAALALRRRGQGLAGSVRGHDDLLGWRAEPGDRVARGRVGDADDCAGACDSLAMRPQRVTAPSWVEV